MKNKVAKEATETVPLKPPTSPTEAALFGRGFHLFVDSPTAVRIRFLEVQTKCLDKEAILARSKFGRDETIATIKAREKELYLQSSYALKDTLQVTLAS